MTKKIVFLELKTKSQAIILTISYIKYLQVLITTTVWNVCRRRRGNQALIFKKEKVKAKTIFMIML